jgi:DNA-directed RNA polymerase subunit beta'
MLGLKENVIVGHKIPAGTGMKKFRDLLVGSVDDLNRMTNNEEEIVEEKTEG